MRRLAGVDPSFQGLESQGSRGPGPKRGERAARAQRARWASRLFRGGEELEERPGAVVSSTHALLQAEPRSRVLTAQARGGPQNRVCGVGVARRAWAVDAKMYSAQPGVS